MKRLVLSACAVFACLPRILNAQWDPAVRWGLSTQTPEESVRIGDAAFIGELRWHNVVGQEGSGRIVPTRAIWGDLPASVIEIGRRHQSDLHPHRHGGQIGENNRSTFTVVTRGRGHSTRILFVTPADNWRHGRLLVDDIKLVREGEFSADTPELRQKLIEAAVDPESTPLKWSYALRRLYRLDGDSFSRYDVVLPPRLQAAAHVPHWSSGPTSRLEYALRLLLGDGEIKAPDYQAPDGHAVSSTIFRLCEDFAEAPTPHFADTVLTALTRYDHRPASMRLGGWLELGRGLRQAVACCKHPIHRVPADRRYAVNEMLKELFGESNLLLDPPPLPPPVFDPDKAQPWPEIKYTSPEQAAREGDAAYWITFDYYDAAFEEDIEVRVSTTLVAGKALWGKPPFEAIELERKYFPLQSMGVGGRRMGWYLHDMVNPGRDLEPDSLVVISQGREFEFELLHALPFWGNTDTPADDLLRLRKLELAENSSRLMEQLIETVLDPDSSRLLWEFAFRRLYRMADSPEEQFALVLGPRMQTDMPMHLGKPGDSPAHRFRYAIDLVASSTYSPDPQWQAENAARRQASFSKLLVTLEKTPSPDLAGQIVHRLADAHVKTSFGDAEWEEFKKRLQRAAADPEHALRKLKAREREWVNKSLERILGQADFLPPDEGSADAVETASDARE